MTNGKKELVFAFRFSDLNCHLDFDIWNLANGIAPHFADARIHREAARYRR
jgi:hypothetical protein